MAIGTSTQQWVFRWFSFQCFKVFSEFYIGITLVIFIFRNLSCYLLSPGSCQKTLCFRVFHLKMQNISKENFVDEEIQKSTKKIENLTSYGMHQSYSVFFPEEKVCNVTFNIEPFHIHEKAKEAEETFHKVLKSIMVQRQLPQYLYKILLKQKENTALILQQYDLIISEESKSLVEYDKEYRQKSEKHSEHYELLKENIEGLISEINRIGNEEIQNIRISVIQNTKNKTEKYWEKCQQLLDESAADIPFDDYIWKPPTTMLPFNELVNSFLLPQEEVFSKRRDMLSEICESRKYLENEKLDHALKLEKFEKELFEIKDNYKRKKIQFAKLKRKQYILNSRKEALSRELKDLTKSIEKEYEVEKKLVEKYHERRKRKCYMQNEENLKYSCILKDTYIEAYNLMADVINAMIFIMENILEIPKSTISLEGSELIKINILSYLCKKDFWLDFVNAAPKDSLIDDIVLAVEDYWSCLKVYLDELNKRISICLENQELHTCLKLYYSAEKSNSSL